MQNEVDTLQKVKIPFIIDIPDDWSQNILHLSTRIRGMLGFNLKHQSCVYDAATSECSHCNFRQQCHYGLSFEASEPMSIKGFGKVGSLPHPWSLKVDFSGMQVRCELLLLGFECSNIESWLEVISLLPLPTHLLCSSVESTPDSLQWLSLTPVRLRLNGKNPRKHQVADALSAAVARKARLIAILHEIKQPESRLPVPTCSDLKWIESDRYSFRKEKFQPMGGWMLKAQWEEDLPIEWYPWLNLISMVGIGRQTTFGYGRMTCLNEFGIPSSKIS